MKGSQGSSDGTGTWKVRGSNATNQKKKLSVKDSGSQPPETLSAPHSSFSNRLKINRLPFLGYAGQMVYFLIWWHHHS